MRYWTLDSRCRQRPRTSAGTPVHTEAALIISDPSDHNYRWFDFAVPGRTVLRSDERGLPIRREAVEGTEYDFRQPKRIGSIKVDHAFTDLERDAHRRACVQLC